MCAFYTTIQQSVLGQIGGESQIQASWTCCVNVALEEMISSSLFLNLWLV